MAEMKRPILLALLLLVGCSVEATESASTSLGKGGLDPDPLPTVIAPPPPPTVAQMAAEYASYDYDADGNLEIDGLDLMSFEPAADPAGTGKMIIVLVERRITEDGKLEAPVVASLRTFRDDLIADGYRPRFVRAALHRDTHREDGKKLLALRRFLRRVRSVNPSLEGVMLVGSFPDATIFRRTVFADRGASQLALHSERINTRADVVLGDLDGNWESLYVASGTMVSATISTWLPPAPWAPGTSLSGPWSSYEALPWHDYFYLREDSVTVAPTTPPLLGQWVTMRVDSMALAHPELTASDKLLPNPIAVPELLVSRIDARHIAIDPAMPPDFSGRLPLDANGHPQDVLYAASGAPAFTWARSAPLEQRILVDYFRRNHALRAGANAKVPYRTASIQGAADLSASMATFLDDIDPLIGAPYDVPVASLTDYVAWLQQPAPVRGILAHSNMYGSGFQAPVPVALETMLGLRPFNWVTGATAGWISYSPHESAAVHGGFADWEVGRDVFESGVLQSSGQNFFVHYGCGLSVTTLGDGPAYDDPDYAYKNNAESILFFMNGIAIYARGKTFNDLPTNAMGYAGQNAKRFGYGWKGQFLADAGVAAQNPGSTLDGRVLTAKKAYFWTLLGDFTAKIRY